jgi:cellulose biosynthesis protein BcsQ
MKGETVLVIDADPQMSLTIAVELLEAGVWEERFDKWIKEAKEKGYTLYRFLSEYAWSGVVNIKESPLYVHRPNLHLLPSNEELYWYDLEAPKAQDLRGFIEYFPSTHKPAGRTPEV